MSTIEDLQDYVVRMEGGRESLTKPQCQEVIRLTLNFLNDIKSRHWQDLFELLKAAEIREAERNRAAYP